MNHCKKTNVIFDTGVEQASERDECRRIASKITLSVVLDSLTLDHRMLTSGDDFTSRQANHVDIKNVAPSPDTNHPHNTYIHI